MSVATTAYEANLYRATTSASAGTPVLGVCFSGGGSRALSCALGQLSALSGMPSPLDPTRTLLSEASYISSVSGGSWASVAYTFLPPTISDADFLIAPVAPASLTAASVSTMNPLCLGIVPQQFSISRVADFLHLLWSWGFFDPFGPDKRNWFWIAAVGELVLEPFGLYTATYSSTPPYLLPSLTFSLSPEYITKHITSENSSLLPSQFYVCQPNRPTLIVNANMQENDLLVDPPQIPVQATARATGIAGQSPDGKVVGAGLVESFAFTSVLTGQGTSAGTAAVAVNRSYSLCDIAGCSSAFFAEYLLQYINKGLDEIVKELVAKHHLPAWAVTLLEKILQALIDSDSVEVLPQYNYWPLAQVTQPNPQNTIYGFTDGGTFDNSGILGLLAQTDANRIVAFVNTEMPLGRANNQITVDTSIPLLFGSAYPADGSGPYVSFGGMNANKPMSYVQVFDNTNGELDALCQGLYDASCGGPNQDQNLGTHPACFVQTLTTVRNQVANIAEGRQVTVLWIYNNRVNSWQDQINDAGIQTMLASGQSNQHANGTPISQTGTGTGPLANFPQYYTVDQIYLAPEAVTMLAQLSAWNVQQVQPLIAGLLRS
jgi:hypothetical protein